MNKMRYDNKNTLLFVMRVNLNNVLDEGLRIGGTGRRINSKVKDQTNKAKLVMLLRQS
jgi:hypothetical protein